MNRAPALIATAAIAIAALSGCASAGTSTPAAVVTTASAPSAVADPAADPAPSAAASTLCTTHACIVGDLQQSLVGLVAKDGSVITGATCYKKTVKHNAGNTYTAECHVTYSDDTVYSGFATLLVAKDEVSWEPTEEVQ
jgi:hypothetical protein